MVFSSLFFLYAFLPLSLLFYYLCKSRKAKNNVLLVSSLIFYAWGEPKYVLLLVFMSFSSWFFALKIDMSKTEKQAKRWVAAATAINIGLIAFFKYASMFVGIFGEAPEFIRNIALPIGISFYTFQLLTYVIDVYRFDAEALDNPFDVLLYASLFHQCIAGPIVRYKTIARELFVYRDNAKSLLPGISRFTIGLAKKSILANSCGLLAETLLLAPSKINDSALFAQNASFISAVPVLGIWVGLLAFTLQIYLDFSAYSDMAIGLGWMLGLHYNENFKYPYGSKSIAEFWRRWHISLGTFFRDYVFIPLGGSRCSPLRNMFNLFVVWALTGLWHGANWNYVLWGIYYFILLAIEKQFLAKTLDKSKIIPHFYTLFAVYFGFLLFYYSDINLYFIALKSMFGVNGNGFSNLFTVSLLKNNMFLILAAIIACTPLVRNVGNSLYKKMRPGTGRELIRYAVIPIILLLLSTAFLVGDSYNPFIYFKF